MSNRLSWADNAKALGMLLVFWGHLIEQGAFSGQSMPIHGIYKAIYAFHMPFFFLLAGYFFRQRDMRFGALFINKFKTRLVPMLFFVGVATVFWQYPAVWGIENINDLPLQARQKIGLLWQGKPSSNWPCWFLICLFVVELVASEVMPYARKWWSHLLAILAFVGLAWLVTSNALALAISVGFTMENWWFWQEATVALGLYLSGLYLARYLPWLVPDGTATRSLLCFGVSALGFFWLYDLNFQGGLGSVNMSSSSHGDWIYFWPAAVLGSFALIHLSACIPATRLMTYVGNNTVPLLGINGLMLEFGMPRFWALCTPYIDTLMVVPVSFMVAAGSLLASLPLVWLLNKLVPFLIGNWTGSLWDSLPFVNGNKR